MRYWLGYIAYHIGLFAYQVLINLASVFNKKAKLFTEGRKYIFEHIDAVMGADNRQKIWFHCASLGEFEQARPLIEKIRQQYGKYAIVITFFSPSGYEIRKKYDGADYVFYLPLDTNLNATRFVKLVNPSFVFFVKYEIWFHYLTVLKANHIPTYLISANFRPNHIYFKWYGVFFKNMLHSFTHIFCQNNVSANLLAQVGFSNVSVSNDTRYDTVLSNKNNAKSISIIEKFTQNNKILIAGSCYHAEEKIIYDGFFALNDWKIILAPHHIEPSRIEEIKTRFETFGVTTFSELIKDEMLLHKRILIMDNIGMLSSIYQYASVAFIGGGYGKSGLHNTLEAAAFGMPILFGPNNLQKFPESLEMLDKKIAFVIKNETDFISHFHQWNNAPQMLEVIKEKSQQFVINRVGATTHILQYLDAKL